MVNEADLKMASEKITALHKEVQMSHNRYRMGTNSGTMQDLEESGEKNDRSETFEKEWCRRSESNRHGVAPGGF